jgi:hypothetical protein
VKDPERHEQDQESRDPIEIPAGPEAPRAAVNLSTLLDAHGNRADQASPFRLEDLVDAQGNRVDGELTQEPDAAANLPAGQPAGGANLPAGQPEAPPTLPAGPPAAGPRGQLSLFLPAEVLLAATSNRRLRRALREALTLSRYLIGREIQARDPQVSVARVWAFFRRSEDEVPAELRGDPVRAAAWRLERALDLARQAGPPEPSTAEATPTDLGPRGRQFWQRLRASYPELFAVLSGPSPALDIVEEAVRDPHERSAARQGLEAIARDFETRLAGVFRGETTSWRGGFLAGLDTALASAFVLGGWLGQRGLARLPAAPGGGRESKREPENPSA